MLYITLLCIAYILGIIWGLFLTKVGYSPFILLMFAILVFFKKNPHVSRYEISKFILLILCVVLGFISLTISFKKYDNMYNNKTKIVFSGYIERKISDTKYIFINEDKNKFIIYTSNYENLVEDIKIELVGSFLKPSHARNHNRI